MVDCVQGSYPNDPGKSPCVGVVFNGPPPGYVGTADTKYNTCWRDSSGSGSGWQVLLKPVTDAQVENPGLLPATAAVAGPHSSSLEGSCENTDIMYLYSGNFGADN